MRLVCIPIVVLSITLGACGSTQATPASTAPTETKLKQRVESYSAAFLGGHRARAWGHLSLRCRREIGRSEFYKIVSAAHALYGSAKRKGPVRVVSLKGTRARVTYRFSLPVLDQVREPWIFQVGAWRVNDC